MSSGSMMTLAGLRDRWQRRASEWATLGVSVDGAKLAAEVIADLEALERVQLSDAVTLREGSLLGGYSVDHLQRLVSTGQLENVGRKGRPRIRRADVPVKPGHGLQSSVDRAQLDPRRQIVRSVLTGDAS